MKTKTKTLTKKHLSHTGKGYFPVFPKVRSNKPDRYKGNYLYLGGLTHVCYQAKKINHL